MNKNIVLDILKMEEDGVRLFLNDGKLVFSSRKQLSPQILEYLKNNKQHIIDILKIDEKEMKHGESQYLNDPFPLTDVQSAYLIGRENAFEYGGVACHIYIEVEYDHLEYNRVQEIWNLIIQNHEMLRMHITKNNSQKISERMPIDCVKHWEQEGEKNDNGLIARTIFENKMYDIYESPLFDVGVVNSNTGKDIMFLSMDLLIADWTSIWILIKSFEDAYFYNKKIRKPEFTFRDYVVYKESLKSGIQYQKDKKYWIEQIDKLPLAPVLPHNNYGQCENRFEHYSFLINKSEWEKISFNSKEMGLTPTITVMAAYSCVIRKWSKNKSFSLNLTLLNRPITGSEIENVVGDFTELLIVPCEDPKGKSFKEIAKDIQKKLAISMEHRSFSGVNVLHEVSLKKGRENSLMPYVFTSAIGMLSKTEDGIYVGKMNQNSRSQTPQVFIDCQAMDDADGLKLFWDVRAGVFPDGLISDMFKSLECLLKALSKKDVWSEKVTILLPEWQQIERRQINNTGKKYEMSRIEEAFELSAERYPGKIAVVDREKKYTYKEIMDYSICVKKILKDLNCGIGSHVGIILRKSSFQIIAALGIMGAGAVFVPVDISFPESRKKDIIESSNINIVICESNTKTDNLGCKHIYIDKISVKENGYMRLSANEGIKQNAYIIFTSGSTGHPKGVKISHQAVMNTILDINERMHINKNDVFLGISKNSFDLSVYDFFGSLVSGASVVLPKSDNVNPEEWEALILEYNITVWNSVPALMQILVSNLKEKTDVIKYTLGKILLSGDWIPIDLPNELFNIFPDARVMSLGGATEASIWSIYHECYQGEKYVNSVPYGKPLNNQKLFVKDEEMIDTPVWVEGEIYIGGAGVGEEYVNNDQMTKKHFIILNEEKLYKTGDIGRYLPGGEIEFRGREDLQVKVNGYRIEMGEIENRIAELEGITRAVVFLNNNKHLCCAVVSEKKMNDNDVIMHLKKVLPNYMIPYHIYFVKNIPMTENGKIDRKKLSLVFSESFESKKHNGIGINDKLTLDILEMWKEVLNKKYITPKDNLYDLGADSLVMAQVASKIKTYCNYSEKLEDITFDQLLRQLLSAPSVEQICEYLLMRKKEIENEDYRDKKERLSNIGELKIFHKENNDFVQVLLHAGFGTLNCYRFLIPYMEEKSKGSLAGIFVKDPERYCKISPENLIETLADEYTNYILNLDKTNVQIIGYCVSGLLAIEIAKRLTESNIDISDVILIDSHPMGYQLDDDVITEILYLPSLGITVSDLGFGLIEDEQLFEGLYYLYRKCDKHIPNHAERLLPEKFEKLKRVLDNISSFSQEERFEIYSSVVKRKIGTEITPKVCMELFYTYRHSFLAARFKPDIYVGNIHFLLAEETSSFIPESNDITLAFWESICLGEFAVETIPGNHITCTENKTNAKVLCDKIMKSI